MTATTKSEPPPSQKTPAHEAGEPDAPTPGQCRAATAAALAAGLIGFIFVPGQAIIAGAGLGA